MTLAGPTIESATSDEALADGARRGARNAFVVLVARYRDRIYRLAFRMSHNASDAEEIAQDTFLHAHRAIASFHGESRFGTWLYRIAVNEALMRQRSARRRPLESLDVLMPRFADLGATDGDASESVDELVDAKMVRRRVREALDQLDADHRAALVLRDLEELSAEEAGEILGISPEAVRQRAHRARLKMRGVLGDILADRT
ncbi:MAG TPA: sigma-70 family RNA polymerase sigma factor [Polyangiaceae bacterium]|jgi:RNA polymerase sigma-70 factor (ECF subfamily)